MEEDIKKEEPKKNGSRLIIIVAAILIIIGIVLGCVFLLKGDDKKDSDTNTNTNTNTAPATPEPLGDDEPLPDGYDASTYYGKTTVRGYVTTEKVYSGDVVTEDSPSYDMVFLNIMESNSNELLAFVELYGASGNSYVNGKAIAIGCVKDGKLVHYNDSDDYGMQEYVLDEASTTQLMNSTKEAPVTLEVERYKFTGGSGAPDCYSHISTIKIKEY